MIITQILNDFRDCMAQEPNSQSQDRKSQLRLWATSEMWTKARERKEEIGKNLKENPPKWMQVQKETPDSGKTKGGDSVSWSAWISSFWPW